ncbi:hypothetical protein LZ24_00343 [Desulfobotulus alkaliphilus]|uniref:Uncharacterized protein n=1 Tax=Desulfobotulus alkaliphilus TaxID=622671 RepID=A0A562S601_9BACT|nr:hypothetical protein LZ24_00343 [Desulfobotulus alkaliphilus]
MNLLLGWPHMGTPMEAGSSQEKKGKKIKNIFIHFHAPRSHTTGGLYPAAEPGAALRSPEP